MGIAKSIITVIFAAAILSAISCQSKLEADKPIAASVPPAAAPSPIASPTSQIPNLRAELLDERNKTTAAPIGTFDFKNYTYELPRGWQNPDGSGITLTDGRVAPVSVDVNESMSDEERADRKAMRRIGLSYVTTKYLDVTGDGEDEAIVVLKIETSGSAIPQVVYVFTWRAGRPEIIWPFRTGDRADGGLKDIRAENGHLVLELYGQDRFLLGQTETGKITGDEEQLCCPTYFTRTNYKWNGSSFLMDKKRLTFSMTDLNGPSEENLGDKVNLPPKGKK